MYGQITFDKGAKNAMKQRNPLQRNSARKIRKPHAKE